MDPRSIADALIVAERERKAIAPFTDNDPELDVETGYLAQRMVVQHRLDRGERVIGAKLGLTSRAKQEAITAQGAVVATAAGGAVLGHPAAAVAWLVNKLPPGDWPLEPGALVLSGGLTAPVPMRPGSVVSAEFDRLGAIEVFS